MPPVLGTDARATAARPADAAEAEATEALPTDARPLGDTERGGLDSAYPALVPSPDQPPSGPGAPGIWARPRAELGSPYEFIRHTLPVAVVRGCDTTGLP